MAMSERPNNNWADNFYHPDELAKLAEIERKLTPEYVEAYRQKWATLIEEIKNNLHPGPESSEARPLTARWRELLRESFAGQEQLLAKIGQADREGAIPREYSMIGPEV